MNKYIAASAALLASTAIASAGGLDRSGQSASAIFEADNTIGLSFGVVTPSLTGTDALANSYDVGERYSQTTLSFTNSINDRISYAIIYDQPYGANITYGNNPLTSTLGGTMADLSSQALTLVGRYQINDRFSVFGGFGTEAVEATVALNGVSYAGAISTAGVTGVFNAGLPPLATPLDSAVLGAALQGSGAAQTAIDTAYGAGTFAALAGQVGATQAAFNATDGYHFDMDTNHSITHLIGAAYEIPDIAFRLAVTYRFETEHSGRTTENLLGSTVLGRTDYVTPQSLNIEFQTGIAADTLLTAGYRWTEFSAVDLVPTRLGSDLVNLEDIQRFTLGVGRRFSDAYSGSVTLSYEPEGDGTPMSPLGPTDGLFGISIGGRYTNGNMNISGGINYSLLGDADAGVAGQPVAAFRDNSAIAVGLRTEFSF